MIDNELAQPATCSKQPHDFVTLRQFSARIGSDPFLVQASTGNASIKIDGDLWIKASGKWLADAQKRQIFVAMQLARIRDLLLRGEEMPPAACAATGKALQPSIETPMHAVLPHRVVIHVHSISTIAWAVQQDGQSRLGDLLAGLRWTWIPYVDSGVALALEIQDAIEQSPDVDVFVLANHGLVICAPDCHSASLLLNEVEQRVAVRPRQYPTADTEALQSVARDGEWDLPCDDTLHALGTDPISRRILENGVLYPCQAVFFHCPRLSRFLIVEGCGVLLAPDISRAERAMLTGLAHVILRISGTARIRYLAESELSRLSPASTEHYRELVENAAAY